MELDSFSSIRKKMSTVNHDTCQVNIKEKSVDCNSRELKEVPQDLNSDIEKLNLQENLIRKLWNTSFQKYSQLIELNLKANLIFWIQEGSFNPLVNLMKLDLSFNPGISYVPRGIFRMLCKLRELYIAVCNLTSFAFIGALNQKSKTGVDNSETDGKSSNPNPAICGQRQMDIIDLYGNYFTNLIPQTVAIDSNFTLLKKKLNPLQTVDPDTIAALHVKWLQFGSYPLSLEVIKNITLGVSKSTIIERLDIVYARITYIPSHLFEHLRNKTLISLDLSGNNILLCPGIFKDLTHVYALHLFDCGIDIIDPQYFDGMEGLRVLEIYSSRLSSVNPLNITWSANLDEIDLGLYQSINLEEYAFRGLPNLTRLSLEFGTSEKRRVFYWINQENLQYLHLVSSTGWKPVLTLKSPNLKTFNYEINGRLVQMDYNVRVLSHVAQSIETVTLNAGLTELEIFELDMSRSFFSDLPKLIFIDLSEN